MPWFIRVDLQSHRLDEESVRFKCVHVTNWSGRWLNAKRTKNNFVFVEKSIKKPWIIDGHIYLNTLWCLCHLLLLTYLLTVENNLKTKFYCGFYHSMRQWWTVRRESFRLSIDNYFSYLNFVDFFFFFNCIWKIAFAQPLVALQCIINSSTI